MNVARWSFNSLGETTTHGRVFLISFPFVGSSETRKTSPRRGELIPRSNPFHRTPWGPFRPGARRPLAHVASWRLRPSQPSALLPVRSLEHPGRYHTHGKRDEINAGCRTGGRVPYAASSSVDNVLCVDLDEPWILSVLVKRPYYLKSFLISIIRPIAHCRLRPKKVVETLLVLLAVLSFFQF